MPLPWMTSGAVSTSSNTNGTIGNGATSSNSASDPWAKKMESSGSSFRQQNGGSSGGLKKIKIMFWPADATEDDLRNLFAGAGGITQARVLPPRDGRDITLCFITFSSEAEAEAAVQEFDNNEINGRRIKVQLDDFKQDDRNAPQTNGGSKLGWGSSGDTARVESSQVKVTFWPSVLTEDDLRNLFAPAGDITRVRVLPPRDGRDFTLSFVTYSNSAQAKAAVEQFNNHETEGRRIRVQLDDNSSGRGGAPSSGFGGGSRESSASGSQVKVLSCPSSLSEDDLKAVFADAGNVKLVKILPPRDDRDVTLGFVTFEHDNEAAAAVEKFNNYEIEGKRLRVSINERNGGQQQRDSKPLGWGASSANEAPKSWGNSGVDSSSASKPWGSTSPASDGAAKPWGSEGTTSNGGTKQWGNTGTGSQQGGSDRTENSFNRHGSQENGVSNGYGGGDRGFMLADGEMNADFSLQGQLSGRPPVIYIPPPPPENEAEIFSDSCHQGLNFEKYENIPVEVTGTNPPGKISTFQEADLHEVCQHNIKRAKYGTPTPVQKHTLPVILSGRDLMACAQTGSGKTAAYLLPMISMLLNKGIAEASYCEVASPNALIIAPTRELAIQIFLEVRKFAYGSPLQTVVVYGGVSVSHQLGKLYDGCNILVATPGRLNDFIGRGRVSLSAIDWLILDEADRMLDMGFGPVIQDIIESDSMTPKEQRQTLMLSATFPESIQTLAARYLREYVFVTVGRVGGASTDIVQTILEIPGSEKRAKLEEILLQSGADRTLVFVETKRSADFLATYLSQRNFPTTSISSDRTQEERECALRDFRAGRAPVLIATAVAARGLDIPDVKHVVNFDLPNETDEYVHRIGRTGRIGNQGRATAFFDRIKDTKLARGLVKILSESSQEVPEWLEEIAMSAVGTGYGPGGGHFSSRDNRENNNRPRPGSTSGGHFANNNNSQFGGQAAANAPAQSNGGDAGDLWC